MSCLDFDNDNAQELKRIIYSEELLTEEQAKLLSKVATAGMLNLDRKEKVSSAILYDEDLSSINDTAVILNRGSAGILNEFLFAGFEGFGLDKRRQSSTTQSGINASNMRIRNQQAQLKKTGKSVGATLAEIKTDITTNIAEQHSGSWKIILIKKKR